MKCEKLEQHLIEFAERKIPASKEIIIREHIKKCEKCKILFEEFSGLWEMVNLPDEEVLSPYFEAKLKRRIEEYEKPAFPKTLIPSIKYLKPVIVGFLFILGVLFGIELGQYPTLEENFTMVQEQKVIPDQIHYLSLFDDIPDGSIGYTYLNLQDED